MLPALVIVLSCLDLSLSLAHALEAPPRLGAWPLDLWREVTVFHGQFAVFGLLGGPVEIATILATAALAITWRRAAGGRLAAFAVLCFGLALISWFIVVAPANAVLATWQPGPLPADADAIRLRWEAGHLLGAAFKLLAVVLVALAVARGMPRSPMAVKQARCDCAQTREARMISSFKAQGPRRPPARRTDGATRPSMPWSPAHDSA